MDKCFWMYGEDSEWCMRLRRAGVRIVYAPLIGVVYHVGAASSDLLWTERDRLARCHRGGLEAYAALNGTVRGALYHATELVIACVRWGVYRAAGRVRPGDYLAGQADFYGWLARLLRVEAATSALRRRCGDGRQAPTPTAASGPPRR